MLKRNSLPLTTVVLTILLLGSAVLARFGEAQTSNPAPRPVVAQPNGRWQIVNPTPEYVGHTMLLDTQTGRIWEVCTVDKKQSWCAMHRYEEGEVSPVTEKEPSGN
jgi:hypothetical protein